MKEKEIQSDFHFAKKSLGQNFLKSQKAIRQIAGGAGDLTGKKVLEIGPGMGYLTEELLKTSAQKITLIELDDRLIPVLQEKFSQEILDGRVEIIHFDILKIKLEDFGFKKGEYILIANIPYYITGAIMKNIIGGNIYPEKAVVLVQKEVAKRIIANDKKESILSIAIKSIGSPKIIDIVPAGSFVPAPRVDSAILLIDKISKETFDENPENEERFFKTLHAGFAHKRKLLKSNLKDGKIFKNTEEAEAALVKADIKKDARPEILTVKQWKALSSLAIL